MNFSFYILGTPGGRYSQYPDDYTASTLAELQEGMAGARLVIYREMDLVHYAYTERLGDSDIIGFCLIFNKATIQKPRLLIQLFRFIIEKRIVESGEIIRYAEDGELRFRVKTMNECVKEYDRLKSFLNSEFENNASKYSITPLTTIYNGVRSTGELDCNASDSQISAMTTLHNKVVVNEDGDIGQGYIPKVISSLREQNQKAAEEISRLQEENASIEKKKKQYKTVVSLFIVVVICSIGLLLFCLEVTNKTQLIQKMEKDMVAKGDSLLLQNREICKLNNQINILSKFKYTTGASIRTVDNADNSWIMWIRANTRIKIISFFVKGCKSSNGKVVIGIYDSNDNLIATKNANISSTEFKKVILGDSWQLSKGSYYIRIIESNGNSLQYHRSNDKEYAQFAGGALEVTGCSSYNNRNEADSKNKHEFYQYFYNIQYEIVPNAIEMNVLEENIDSIMDSPKLLIDE